MTDQAEHPSAPRPPWEVRETSQERVMRLNLPEGLEPVAGYSMVGRLLVPRTVEARFHRVNASRKWECVGFEVRGRWLRKDGTPGESWGHVPIQWWDVERGKGPDWSTTAMSYFRSALERP